MRVRGKAWRRGLLAAILAMPHLLNGCGTVGPPMAPEDVGIGPLMERQDRARAEQAAPQQAPPEKTEPGSPQQYEPVGQDEVLPPLRPVGGR